MQQVSLRYAEMASWQVGGGDCAGGFVLRGWETRVNDYKETEVQSGGEWGTAFGPSASLWLFGFDAGQEG